MVDGKVVKGGDQLTVDWLRKHHGVAVWPASYYRYKRGDGSASGIYPNTGSKKFEFTFSYLNNLRKKFGIDLPTTFYWSESKWNPQNFSYREIKKEYPFQLISGRVHHAMTMTTVCPYLSETETECMRLFNNDLTYTLPAERIHPEKFSFPEKKTITLQAGSVSIPVFAFNREDGERLGITTGCIVRLENPLNNSIRGKVILTEEVMPGVIKTAFGPGGQSASGMGFMNTTSDYTPNINELFDPENLSPFTGMPGFGDIMVRVIKD
jgi:anaerobic selenocysteine-containing dehydrogenase